ncbi:Mediator of RNA polymerase II transcription subunit 5 [Nakaseomyces bracarensis]|uniref:Mediator of RNA polymerase II transcription subunit 5 n=1 Tax=Nakaseomyces bracarensis TaxID=273131 RepID=A0ABR4NZS4_9SACH
METKSVSTLALRCAEKKLAALEFLNLYKEFFNERFPSSTIESESVNTTEENIVENADNETGKSQVDAESSKERPAVVLSSEFFELLNTGKSILLADYVVEVLFVNYYSDLVREYLPKLKDIKNTEMLVHFFSKSCSFFVNLSDDLVITQLNKDLKSTIIPCILEFQFNDMKNELTVSIAKFLQAVLKFAPQPIQINSDSYRDNAFALTKKLSSLNRILSKKLGTVLEKKLHFKENFGPFSKDSAVDFDNSPSITSPQFISSPLHTSKGISQSASHSAIKYKDMKLLRYYKNIWLNSKLMKWQPVNSEFLSRYSAIKAALYEDHANSIQNVDSLFIDLIETSFTCFAQFVSNKLYHQANSTYNLLEYKWILFLSKFLPLLISKNSSRSSHVISNALDNIDDKAIKAIRAYYAEKDDGRNRNDDLFDDYPLTSLDIRHEFIKALTMLGVVPPAFIHNYLQEDQIFDSKSLTVTDDLMFINQQGIQEIVSDIKSFIKDSLESLEIENISEDPSESKNGLFQVFMNFESVPPTKQLELAENVLETLQEASQTFDYNTIVKLTALLSFNFSHSLTSILMYVTPKAFARVYLDFVDNIWSSQVANKSEEGGESQFENVNISMSFSWSILILTILVKHYKINFLDIYPCCSSENIKSSFAVRFVENLPDISDLFFIDEKRSDDPEIQVNSHKLVRDWLNDLFVNGSLSDALLQDIVPKQLAILVPYIFKQVTLAMEIGAVGDLQNLIGGFEYFLQPFMLVGLIKVVYWLEQYLSCLKSDNGDEKLVQKVLSLLNTIINPSTLNEDSKAFHSAVLRLNAIPLLGILNQFKSNAPSEFGYGIYSSDNEGNPTLESIITRILKSLSISPVYDVDPVLLNNDNSFSQKPPKFNEFFLTNETPMNKVLTNQMNSFWCLHSSTYYNLDYLRTVIDAITPRKFLIDVLLTLEYKLSTFGARDSRNKMSSNETEHVLDYFFYFLVLLDISSPEESKAMIEFMEGKADAMIMEEVKTIKTEPQPKLENSLDDDIDMLFGENDTSMQGNDDDDDDVMAVDDVAKEKGYDIRIRARNSFGMILQEIKMSYDGLDLNSPSYNDYKKYCNYHDKYLNMLKTCVF